MEIWEVDTGRRVSIFMALDAEDRSEAARLAAKVLGAPVTNVKFVGYLYGAYEIAGSLRRVEAYAALESERRYQDEKHPRVHGWKRTIGEEILCMEEYLLAARNAWKSGNDFNEHDRRVMLDQIRNVAALGVRCMEQWGSPVRERQPQATEHLSSATCNTVYDKVTVADKPSGK